MPWNNTLTLLNDILADYYPKEDDSRRIVTQIGLKQSKIAFNANAELNWFHILEHVENRFKTLDLLDWVIKDYPEDPRLPELRNALYEASLGKKAQLNDLKIQISKGPDVHWREPEQEKNGETLEKIIGKESTLLPIGYLETGLKKAKKVGRILVPTSDGRTGLGTGFLTEGNMLITNNHVVCNIDAARNIRVQFGYELGENGLFLQPEEFRAKPEDGFATSVEDDWTAVKLKGDPVSSYGSISLEPSQLATVKIHDRVTIIQHPGGGHKQIGMHHNYVKFVGHQYIQYLTDTLPGSSGSPVFDKEWKLVALHHSGGHLKKPGEEGFNRTFYRNEGINIFKVVSGLKQANIL